MARSDRLSGNCRSSRIRVENDCGATDRRPAPPTAGICPPGTRVPIAGRFLPGSDAACQCVDVRQLHNDRKVADAEAGRGLGDGLRRQNGDRRDRAAPGVRARRCRRQQPRQGRPGRRRDLRHRPIGGIAATDDVDALVALRARRAGPLRADRRPRRGQHPRHRRVPARRHRRVLDRDDAVGVAGDAPEPAELDRARSPRRARRAARRASPPASTRLRQRPVPDDADGPVLGGAPGAGARDPRLHQLRGRLRERDGHRPPARVPPAARAPRHPRSWRGARPCR